MKRSEVEETGRRGARACCRGPTATHAGGCQTRLFPTRTVELERAFSRGPGAVDSTEEEVTKAIQNSKVSLPGILSLPWVWQCFPSSETFNALDKRTGQCRELELSHHL